MRQEIKREQIRSIWRNQQTEEKNLEYKKQYLDDVAKAKELAKLEAKNAALETKIVNLIRVKPHTSQELLDKLVTYPKTMYRALGKLVKEKVLIKRRTRNIVYYVLS